MPNNRNLVRWITVHPWKVFTLYNSVWTRGQPIIDSRSEKKKKKIESDQDFISNYQFLEIPGQKSMLNDIMAYQQKNPDCGKETPQDKWPSLKKKK